MNETTAQAKEPYEEPFIEDVPLQSDDMMVGNCKGDGTTPGRRLWHLLPGRPHRALQKQLALPT